uniref:Uncharacterized protein ycf35 n=1 Tax=Saccharina sp. TaxID=2044565 RepID=A0A8K1HDG5_9PHAE|nr:YCF35 [Saccharina sp.]
MSHYTSIKTKYTNPTVLKKVINKLGYPYVEHNNNNIIEVPVIFSKSLKSSIYENSYQNYLAFKSNNLSYDIVTDSQSWTQKEIISTFLKKLELNYGYSETIHQALDLGFVRSKVLTTNNNNNRFVFQRCVEVKR